MVQGTEVFEFALAAILAPTIIFSLRRLNMPSKPYIAAALLALTLSYLFTVLEGFVAPVALNVLEHAMLALSGVMFAMAAWISRQYWHKQGGE